MNLFDIKEISSLNMVYQMRVLRLSSVLVRITGNDSYCVSLMPSAGGMSCTVEQLMVEKGLAALEQEVARLRRVSRSDSPIADNEKQLKEAIASTGSRCDLPESDVDTSDPECDWQALALKGGGESVVNRNSADEDFATSPQPPRQATSKDRAEAGKQACEGAHRYHTPSLAPVENPPPRNEVQFKPPIFPKDDDKFQGKT